jgi:hypothetical protein
MKRILAFIPLTLCLLFLTYCEDWAYSIKYEVTGTAPKGGVSVLFVNEYGDDEAFSSIRLPWIKEFNVQFRDETYYGGKFVSGVFPAYLSATITTFGYLTTKIYYDGKLVDSVRTTGPDGVATARYGVKLK